MTDDTKVKYDGEQHVPQIPEGFESEHLVRLREQYVEAWNEWRHKQSFNSALLRDQARNSFYAAVGRAVTGKHDDR